MPPVTLAVVVDLTKVKMKWKEIYVSEGLNRKVIPAMAKGIYSGLRLIQNISSPRQVEVASTPDGTHAAVHQSAAGFSTTYHDNAGVSTILDLNSASLDNQETVIALSITYTIGADTTANWIAYPIADWNALTDAQRAERIVLGTVNVPAPATNITTAMILPSRRTIAWDSVAPGAVPWTPVIQNGGFEHSVDDGTFIRASSYWQLAQHANGEWKVQSTDPYAGIRAMAFNQLIAAAPVAWIDQYIGIPAKAGQLIRYKFRIKNLKVPTGGALTFDLLFADTSFGAFVSASVTVPMVGVDASYRLIEGIVAAPANALQLYSVRFTNQLNQGSTGIAFRLDDVQVWVETGEALKAPSSEEQTRRPLSTESIVIESSDDPLADYYGPAALLRMPVNDQLWLTRRDGDVTTGTPIELALRTARITQLGADLLNTAVRARSARISSAYSGTHSRTLLLESLQDSGSGEAIRIYETSAGHLEVTVNASFDGTNWNKDVGASAATMLSHTPGSLNSYFRAATAAGAWATWTSVSTMTGSEATTLALPVFAPLLQFFDPSGNRRVAQDHLGLRRGTRTEIHQNWLAPMFAGWTSVLAGSGGLTVATDAANKPNAWLEHTIIFSGDKAAKYVPNVNKGPMPATSLVVIEFDVDASTALVGTLDVVYQAGLIHDETSYPSTEDYIKVLKTSASANWVFATYASTGAAGTSVNTGVAASGVQRFRIEVYGSSLPGGKRALCFINGALVAQITTNMPDTQNMTLEAFAYANGVIAGPLYCYTSAISYVATRHLSDDAI
jgi:hypothetical protein